MIEAARKLFRVRGYVGTSMADILAESGAPRGSVYFHFPGGKEELATEVAITHTAGMTAMINRLAAGTPDAATLLSGFVAHFRDDSIADAFGHGCALAPLVMEGGLVSPALAEVVRRGYQDTITTLATRLGDCGIQAENARELATLALTGVEGALIMGRVLRSPEPFDVLSARLVASLGEQVQANAPLQQPL